MTETKEKQRGSARTGLWRVVSCASESRQKQWKSFIVSAVRSRRLKPIPSVIAHPDVAFDHRISQYILTLSYSFATLRRCWFQFGRKSLFLHFTSAPRPDCHPLKFFWRFDKSFVRLAGPFPVFLKPYSDTRNALKYSLTSSRDFFRFKLIIHDCKIFILTGSI